MRLRWFITRDYDWFWHAAILLLVGGIFFQASNSTAAQTKPKHLKNTPNCTQAILTSLRSGPPTPGEITDEYVRAIAQRYGNPPAVYARGETYGAAPKGISLFRGVAGPDHDLTSVIEFLQGDRRYELMSPVFRRALDEALNRVPFESAYKAARQMTANAISEEIEASGLERFAYRVTGLTSTGLSPKEKGGEIVKFTNSINDAVNYAASRFEDNLDRGMRISPVVFGATGNESLVLGESRVPTPGSYHEYDFLSNVSIRHIRAIFIGLVKPSSVSVWDMPWVKIIPIGRRADGSFRSFSVEFVDIEKKIPMEIYEKTKTWPTYELKNLEPRKYVGLFSDSGSVSLSPDLTNSELATLKPLLDALEKSFASRNQALQYVEKHE